MRSVRWWSDLAANRVFDEPDAGGAALFGEVRITDTTAGAGCCSNLSSRFDLVQ
jgi:hypothetical protein